MEPWILATFAAALLQTVRFSLQKHLSGAGLSAAGATFARFLFAAPLAVAGLALWLWVSGRALPPVTGWFWLHAVLGGVTQILATVCVILVFKSRNFAVGITLKKTEVLQTALVGFVLFGEGVSAAGLMAMLIGLAGVLLLSDPPGAEGRWLARLWNPAAGLGLLSGFIFALSGVEYRAATLSVLSDEPLMRAAVTLAVATTLQTAIMIVWLARREPGQIARVWAARRTALWVGLSSMGGTLGWFTAFTLQTAAYVYAVGQVELIFSMAAGALFFRETLARRELAGIVLLGVSIVTLILVI